MAIWLRIGDQGDYTKHEALTDVATALLAAGVSGPLSQHSNLAVSAAGFEQRNYISLFYGSADEPTPYAGLAGTISPTTVQYINNLLAGAVATPEKPQLFQLMDKITECWKAIEEDVLARHSPPLGGGKLTVGRHPGTSKMRLLYDDKPLTDCSVAEKLAAADGLAGFRTRLAAADADLLARARTALSTLESWPGIKIEKE